MKARSGGESRGPKARGSVSRVSPNRSSQPAERQAPRPRARERRDEYQGQDRARRRKWLCGVGAVVMLGLAGLWLLRPPVATPTLDVAPPSLGQTESAPPTDSLRSPRRAARSSAAEVEALRRELRVAVLELFGFDALAAEPPALWTLTVRVVPELGVIPSTLVGGRVELQRSVGGKGWAPAGSAEIDADLRAVFRRLQDARYFPKLTPTSSGDRAHVVSRVRPAPSTPLGDSAYGAGLAVEVSGADAEIELAVFPGCTLSLITPTDAVRGGAVNLSIFSQRVQSPVRSREVDPGGTAVFRGIEPGTYEVDFVDTLHVSTPLVRGIQAPNLPLRLPPFGIELRPAEQRTLSFSELGFGASLSGRVVFEEGDPAPGLNVLVYYAKALGEAPQVGGYLTDAAVTVVTDPQGRYRASGLPFFDYRVQVEPFAGWTLRGERSNLGGKRREMLEATLTPHSPTAQLPDLHVTRARPMEVHFELEFDATLLEWLAVGKNCWLEIRGGDLLEPREPQFSTEPRQRFRVAVDVNRPFLRIVVGKWNGLGDDDVFDVPLGAEVYVPQGVIDAGVFRVHNETGLRRR
jgi:hypothetical protein